MSDIGSYPPALCKCENKGMISIQAKKKYIYKDVRKLAPFKYRAPGRVAQSVTCLATDVQLTADPGVACSIPARSHTFVEINHEIISMVIPLPSAESFKKGCCQLQAKECARRTG